MKYVLITGATSGIGYALAEIFAKKGYPLVLVGRDERKLAETEEKLQKLQKSHQPIKLICQDLSKVGAAQKVYESVKAQSLKIEILVNNAGAGYSGEFIHQNPEQITEHIELNMTSLTLLTRYFAEDMKKQGSGKILNLASTGAYHPGIYTAVYYATKSYVLSLSEALYEELKPYGVQVSSLCPGATKTNFAKAAGRENAPIAMPPEFVAHKAYEGLMKNKKVIVPGLKNKAWIILPKCIATFFIKRYQKSLLIK